MPLPKAPSKLATIVDRKKLSHHIANKKNTLVKPSNFIPDKLNPLTPIEASSTLQNHTNTQHKNIGTKKKTKISILKKNILVKESSKNISLKKTKKLFVLDTNVLMHDPTSLFRFQEHDIYIPMVTLEELDEHKTGMSEVSRNVRQVARSIDSLIGASVEGKKENLNLGIPLDSLGHIEAFGSLFFQTEKIQIDISPGLELDKPDNQILGIVKALKDKYKKRKIVLVSKDINIRIKAKALSLFSEDYFNDSVVDDDDLLYTGAKFLPESFWKLYKKDTETWQQNGEIFYKLTGPIVNELHVNQFIIEEKEKNLFAIVEEIQGKSVILKTLKDFSHPRCSVWGISSRNREQNFALNLLMTPEIDFVTLLGQAGTGKTLLALAAGLTQTLESGLYSEIIVTRATVPIGGDIGYLPGTEEEKMIPWMGALEDNLEVLHGGLEAGKDWSRSATVELIKSKIKIKSLSFMRGRTFINKFLIIDEAQNLTPKEMKALITRAGPGTKVVCLGNIAQIDSPYLTESSSGLTYVVDRFKCWRHGGHVTLQRGERSRLADFASEML